MPSKSLPSASASLSLMFRYRTFCPIRHLCEIALIWRMTGSAAILSLRGKMPVTITVASGALLRIAVTIACIPLVMSAASLLRPSGIDAADVVGAGQQNHDLRIYVIQLAVVQAPEDVLNSIRAPAEIGRIPAEEVLIPVGEQFRDSRWRPIGA